MKKKKETKSIIVISRLMPSTVEELDKLAAKERRSRSQMIDLILLERLKK